MHKGPTDDLIQRLHLNLLNRLAINLLNNSPAVESVSPTGGSRHDHSFYICRLCHTNNTHIMNIGATLHYITQIHTPECYVHQDKLTREAFGHLTEVRHLLRQTNDRRVFTIIRSTSDSLPIINWRGNSPHSNVDSLKPSGKRISSSESQLQKLINPLRYNCLTGPPHIGASKFMKFQQRCKTRSIQVCPWTCRAFSTTLTTDWTTRRKSPET